MWDMHISCTNESTSVALLANNRTHTADDMVRSIPDIYYKNTKAKNILDKSRSWTMPANVAMLQRYIRDDPKIIVMLRPVDEIVKSFVELRKRNGWTSDFEQGLWEPNTEPLTRPLVGVEYAKGHNTGEYLFIEYNELVENTSETLQKIYTFCDWETFPHWFNDISNPYPENDSVWGFPGLHDVRPTIG